MNHSEIAHRWAAQYEGPETKVKDMTKSGGGSRDNVTFQGPSLYSYSTVIGRFREHKGKLFLLENATNYSRSTYKHKNHMNRAISHFPEDRTFQVGNKRMGVSLDDEPQAIYQYAIERAADCAEQATRARTNKPYLLHRSEEWLRDAQRISDFFGLKKKADDKAIEKLAKEKAKAEKQYAKERKEQKRRDEERRLRRIEEAKIHLKEWLAGGPLVHNLNDLPVRLRKMEPHVGDPFRRAKEIETSHGAVIPYEDGLRCYRFCARLWRREEAWHRNGEQFKVGPYHLDQVNMTGIVAGCHVISREEIERFAQQEGWSAPTPPSPLTEGIQYKIEDGWLVISGRPDEDAKDIHEALERMVSNCELSWISPNETGDMTEAPILGIRDEHGNATDQRWGYMDYAITDPLEQLREKGEIKFQPAS